MNLSGFKGVLAVVYGAFFGICGVVQALEVESEADGLVVKGRGEVSVFSPRPTEVWIVAPDDTRGTVTARTGWEVGWLQAGVPALRLKTPAARDWHVVNGPHATFEVRVGKPKVRGVVLPKQSMVVLRDGTVLAKEALQDSAMIAVASDDGMRFKVGTGGRWGVGVEDTAVVQGGVVAVNTTAYPDANQLAMIEPAAGEEPEAIEMQTGADERERAAFVPDQILQPAKAQDSVLPEGLDDTLLGGTGDVPMFGTSPLPSVETPVAGAAAQVEELPRQVALLDARRVYMPGALVPFTMPEGLRLVEGRIVRVPTGKRMESLVNTDMALAEAESRVDALLRDDPLTTPLAAPAEDHVSEAAHEEPVHTPAAADDHAEPAAEHHEAEAAPEEAAHGEEGAEAAGHGEETGEAATDAHGAATEEGHGEVVAAVSETIPLEETDETPAGSWLPATGRLTNYLPQVMKIQHQIAGADSEQAAMAARRALAQHYLAWRRPQEALAVTSLISPSLPVDKLLEGIALASTEDFAAAQERLEDVDGAWKNHAALWRAVTEQGQGASANALDSWPVDEALVKQYPLWLRDIAMQSHAQAMIAVSPGHEAKDYVDRAIETRGRITPAWQRLQGLATLAAKDRAGLEPLAAAAEQTQDLRTAYQAKYDFVQALRLRNELENRQMIDYLEALRYDWRGGMLEQKVLRELGELYVARDDYHSALARWKTLVQAYPDYPAMGQLTNDMSKAVAAVFDPDGKVTYEPLEYLGLYYDFRELLPDDARGDAITEQVANVLIGEGLYDRAMPLLDQLLTYRTPANALDRGRLALAFAKTQRMEGVPQDALRTLDTYEKDMVNSVLKESWNMEVARSLLDLDRPVDAAKALGTMDGIEARKLKLEAQWRNQNWPQVTSLADRILSAAAPMSVATDMDVQVTLLRQAFAHAQLGEGEKIIQLQNRYKDGLAKVIPVRDTMTALAGLNGVEGTFEASDRPLGRFAEALNGINQVAGVMEATRAAHMAEREEQREFNQKMDYMELLPPPAL